MQDILHLMLSLDIQMMGVARNTLFWLWLIHHLQSYSKKADQAADTTAA